MKQSVASGSAEAWNKKNFPSEIGRFEESPGGAAEVIRQLPALARGLARRRPGVWILAGLGILSLIWYVSKRD